MPPGWQYALVVLGYAIALVTVVHIVLERREPTATLAWALGIILVPYLGVLVYLVFGRHRLKRQLRRREVRSSRIEPRLAAQADAVAVHTRDLPALRTGPPDDPNEAALMRLAARTGQRPPTAGNAVDLLVDGAETYPALEEAIEAAQRHVHFQFYIYEPDETGRRFRDLLVKKARQGVQVRVLTDGVGSFGIDTFLIPLVQAGGEHAEFLPVSRIGRRWHPNLRNHRKIVVVDGSVAFTGGVNIGDAYTGRQKKIGHWRDTHLRIRGPAVHHVQEVFAEDWYFATERDDVDESWFPQQRPAGRETVQVVASGPDSDDEPIQRIFFTAVTLARQRVYLTTPYFVPDQAMQVALETAALRGVDVRLLLPHRSDLPLVLHAGRSYYDRLLAAGVRIFEYRPGILHAKTMVVDDGWATVGSANMDVRSFRLNFEMNAAIFGERFAAKLAEVFSRDQAAAIEVNRADLERRGLGRRGIESIARLLSPVL